MAFCNTCGAEKTEKGRCPACLTLAGETLHYDMEVNKGSIRAQSFSKDANKRWVDGWKIAHMFEQDGNTIIIWERRI